MIVEKTLKQCPHCLQGSLGYTTESYYHSGTNNEDLSNLSPSIYSKALVICPHCLSRLWYEELDFIGIVQSKKCILREFMDGVLQIDGSSELKSKFNYAKSREAFNNDKEDEFYDELYEVWRNWEFKCYGQKLMEEELFENHWLAVSKEDCLLELGNKYLSQEQKDYLLWWLDTYKIWETKRIMKDIQNRSET